MSLSRITLGMKVRDVVSGFEGIAVSSHEYMNGCVRIAIQPQRLHDGKPIDAQVFDYQQIEILEAKAIALPVSPDPAQLPLVAAAKGTGGPGDPRLERR